MPLLSRPTVDNDEDWAQNLQMEVSREINRRISSLWFQQVGWATAALPDRILTAISDLRAFHRIAREEIFAPATPLERKSKLDLWTYSLSQAFQGQPHSDAAAAIADTVQTCQVSRAFLYEQLTALESNLYHERLVVDNDLLRLAYRQTGTFLLMVAQVLGLSQPAQRDFFLCLGLGTGLLEILLDWSHWERTQWLPIPRNWLPASDQEHGSWYQADWQKTLTPLSKARQRLIPSLKRRIATLGIETVAQVPPTAAINDSPFANLLAGWREQTLIRLHDVYEQTPA